MSKLSSAMTPTDRLHSMDALRAVAMLLGIVLHAEMAYMVDAWAFWPADDPGEHVVFNISFVIIHFFRMQLFFLMAGFFACMLAQRYGANRFLLHRLKRLGIPLLIGMVTVIPIWHLVASWGFNVKNPTTRIATIDALKLYMDSATWMGLIHPIHLWFLQHLVILCAFGALWVGLASKLRLLQRVGGAVNHAWGVSVRFGLAALLVAVLTFPLLFLQSGAGVDTQMTPWPSWSIVAYYAVYFAGGWMLFRTRDLLGYVGRFRVWIPLLLIGLAAAFVWLDMNSKHNINESNAGTLDRAVSSVATAAFVFGFTGMFLRLCEHPSRVMRYVSDSAYWMYIIHLPLVVAINVVLQPVQMNVFLKFAVTLIASSTLMLVSYHLLVRYTWIGVLLNGPRIRAERRQRLETAVQA